MAKGFARASSSMGTKVLLKKSGPLSPWPGFLYEAGNEHIALTGGWVEGAVIATHELEKQATRLRLYAGPDASLATYVTNTVIDLTGISTLHVDWQNDGDDDSFVGAYFTVTNTKMGTHTEDRVAFILTNSWFARKTETLDVASLSGNYYIRLQSRQGRTTAPVYSKLYVYNVWGTA